MWRADSMLTMRPVIEHGRMTWDRRILPADEYDERRLAVDALCARTGVGALIGFDDGPAPGLAAYLTNHRGGAVSLVNVPGTRPTLITGLGGGRDHPFIKSVAYIEDLRWYPAVGDGLLTVLAEHGLSSGPIGLAGAAECLAKASYDQLLRSLHAFEVRHLDAEVALLRRAKSVREHLVLRRCAAILDEAKSVVIGALRDGCSLHQSLVAGERSARLDGCHDVRVLAAARYGAMAPWPSGALQHDTWPDGWASVYLAGEYLGYWGETGFTLTRPDVAVPDPLPVLDRAVSVMRPGVTGAELRAAAGAAAGEPQAQVWIEAAGVGLRPAEAPLLTQDDSSAARLGDAVNLRVMTRSQGVIGLATSLVTLQPGDGGPATDQDGPDGAMK